VSEPFFTDADRAYIRSNYVELEELCAGRDEEPEEVRRLIAEGLVPRPSYVVDGVGMFPEDYFRLYDEAHGAARLKDLFEARYTAAAAADPGAGTREAIASAWRAYLDGVWGQCLREVTPEAIVRKRTLVDSLCKLIALPRPRSADWRERLRAEATELDELEREFAPDYDRAEWNERPPTRDLLVEVARERFADVFVRTETSV
jgi:Family of unknown function (DUF6058)